MTKSEIQGCSVGFQIFPSQVIVKYFKNTAHLVARMESWFQPTHWCNIFHISHSHKNAMFHIVKKFQGRHISGADQIVDRNPFHLRNAFFLAGHFQWPFLATRLTRLDVDALQREINNAVSSGSLARIPGQRPIRVYPEYTGDLKFSAARLVFFSSLAKKRGNAIEACNYSGQLFPITSGIVDKRGTNLSARQESCLGIGEYSTFIFYRV